MFSKICNLLIKAKCTMYHSLPVQALHRIVSKTPNRETGRSKRASFSASLTVEATLALPLFLFVALGLFSIFPLYSSIVEGTVNLQQKAEELAMVSSAEVLFTDEASDLVIDLWDTASAPMLFLPFGNATLKAPIRARVHAWVGKDPTDHPNPSGSHSEQMVLISEKCTVYHTEPSCANICIHVYACSADQLGSLRNGSRLKYKACDHCVGKGDKNATVYYTPEGDMYHNDRQCLSLVRHIEMVPLDRVSNLQECKHCQKRRAEREGQV